MKSLMDWHLFRDTPEMLVNKRVKLVNKRVKLVNNLLSLENILVNMHCLIDNLVKQENNKVAYLQNNQVDKLVTLVYIVDWHNEMDSLANKGDLASTLMLGYKMDSMANKSAVN